MTNSTPNAKPTAAKKPATNAPTDAERADATTLAASYVQGRRLVRPKVAAAYLQCSRETVYQWAREGRIPQPYKIGVRHSLFDLDAIDRALGVPAEA